jgi:hypothetical protein
MLHLEPEVPVGTLLRVRRVLPEVRWEQGATPLDLGQASTVGGGDQWHRNPILAQVPPVGEVDAPPTAMGALIRCKRIYNF